jgi:hypothetical protein
MTTTWKAGEERVLRMQGKSSRTAAAGVDRVRKCARRPGIPRSVRRLMIELALAVEAQP